MAKLQTREASRWDFFEHEIVLLRLGETVLLATDLRLNKGLVKAI